VWQTLRGGVRVKVRYEQSNIVQEAARVLDKQYRSIIMTEGGLPADLQAQRDAKLCANAILTDWDGVTDDAGAVVPFSPSTALALLSDPEMGDFRRDVIYAARVGENFRAQEQAAVTKN
jgi:hypothetical protein